MPRSLIVITVEGLSAASLSCYGSPWNTTPAIDCLAAEGTVFDNFFADHGSAATVLQSCFAGTHALAAARGDRFTASVAARNGRCQVITDSPALADWLDPELVDRVPGADAGEELADDFSECSLGRLFAQAEMRLRAGQSSQVSWIHTRALTTCWDAPGALWEREIEEEGFELTPQTQPPEYRVEGDEHPDFIIAWQHAYAAQVAMLDEAVRRFTLFETAGEAPPPCIALIGTSGFPIGEHGWIGHGCGPLLSPRTQLPMILYDPLREASRVRSFQQPADVHRVLLDTLEVEELPEGAASESATPAPPIALTVDESELALRLGPWHYFRDEEVERLFVRPDDRYDFNDVARRVGRLTIEIADFADEVRGAIADGRDLPPIDPELLKPPG